MTLIDERIERSYKPLSPREVPYREDRHAGRLAKITGSIEHFEPDVNETPGKVFAFAGTAPGIDRASSHHHGGKATSDVSRINDLMFAALPAITFPLAIVGAMAVVIAVREGAWAYAVPGLLAGIGFSLVGFAALYVRHRIGNLR